MGGKARPTQWRTIPIAQQMRQANGPEVREPVYFFGRTVKVQDIELPGKEYPWAKDIPEPIEGE